LFISETRFIVRYAETDQMGIVHHSNYPIWFEAGRTDYISKAGMPYSKMEEKGVFLPLIGLNCKFKGAARYEDEVIIKTRIKELTFTRVSFYYEVFVNDNAVKPITIGETIHAWTNKLLKPVNIKKYMPEIFDLLNGVISG
jgi:acyl-CoA thioester hydrolase